MQQHVLYTLQFEKNNQIPSDNHQLNNTDTINTNDIRFIADQEIKGINNRLILRPEDLKRCGTQYLIERIIFTVLLTIAIYTILKVAKMKTMPALIFSIMIFIISFFIFSHIKLCSAMNYIHNISILHPNIIYGSKVI